MSDLMRLGLAAYKLPLAVNGQASRLIIAIGPTRAPSLSMGVTSVARYPVMAWPPPARGCLPKYSRSSGRPGYPESGSFGVRGAVGGSVHTQKGERRTVACGLGRTWSSVVPKYAICKGS